MTTIIDTPAYDETIVVSKAWDETIIDSPASSEIVVDTPASDETIIVSEAYDETIIDSPATDVWYSWTGGPAETHPFPSADWQVNQGEHAGFDQAPGLHQRDKGGNGESDYFYHDVSLEVSHVKHHDAVTEVVHHDEVSHVVEHAEVSHVVHHPAVTTVKHHDAVTHEHYAPVTGPDDAWWACTVEDGSMPDQEFPCMWDAALSGNGEGCSFVLDFAGDVPHYITSIGADGTVYTDDAGCVVSVDPTDAAAAPEYVAEAMLTSSEVAAPTAPALAETGSEGASILSGLALAFIVIGVGIVRATRRRATR